MSAKLAVGKVLAELEQCEAFHRDQEARAQGSFRRCTLVLLLLIVAACRFSDMESQGGTSEEQGTMQRRALSELLDKKDPAWPLIQEWTRAAKNPVELLPPDKEAQERVLLEVQVTTHSTLGAVVYETGGILVDDGWLRILGCGSKRLPRSVSDWNFGRTVTRSGEQPGYLLVADDAIGGFFAVNGGALGEDFGNVYYLAPDTLKWESLGRGYTDFLHWSFVGDLAGFYEGQRWESWKADVAALGGDKAFMFYPFLWAEGPEISKRQRSAIRVKELWDLHLANR